MNVAPLLLRRLNPKLLDAETYTVDELALPRVVNGPHEKVVKAGKVGMYAEKTIDRVVSPDVLADTVPHIRRIPEGR